MLFALNSINIFTIVYLLFIPNTQGVKLKNVSLIMAGVTLLTSILLLKSPSTLGIYLNTNSFNIISLPSIQLSYSYLIDNLSIIFIILTTFLTLIVIMTARNVKYRVKEMYLLIFVSELLLVNAFTVTEIILFYIFFEALLVPIFLLIGIWGSQRNKIFAANQFFIYTLFGSFFMLIGIILIYLFIGSSNIFILKNYIINFELEKILFLLLFLGMYNKIPMIPLHLWLPQAHVEAPTTGSILLAGILLKLGSYGFLRFLVFLFPKACFYFLPLIIALTMISIVFSSITVLRQIDLKRIVAYSSIAHMNFLVSAIFVKNLLALTGSLLLQIAHGLSSSALFFIVGILYDRYKTRNIYYYSGLVTILPFLCFFLFIFSLANLGFPGTVNFVSELLLFLGLFKALPSIAILSLSGIFFSAIYSFILVTRIAFGPATSFIRYYYDITRREFLILFPITFLSIITGFMPKYLTSYWTFYLTVWYL